MVIYSRKGDKISMNKQPNVNPSISGGLFSTVANWASILSFLGVPATVIMAIFKHNNMLYLYAVLCLIIFCSVLLLKKHYIQIIKLFFRMFALNKTYKFIEWNAVYTYETENQMSFRSTYLVKAEQSSVDRIRVRFNWSGSVDQNDVIPHPITGSGYETKKIEPDEPKFGYRYYNLFSNNKLNKKDHPVKLGVKILNLEDKTNKASKHLLTSIIAVTDQLNMTVRLPKAMKPQHWYGYEYLHAVDDCHWHDLSNEVVLVEEDDKFVELKWTIKKPIFGGKYCLSWQ